MDKTPIQQAIDFMEAQINKNRDRNDYEAGECRAYENAKDILESLLPKEKEFVGKVFDAGCAYGDSNCEFGGNTALPNRIQFLNQLYPEK